MPKDIPSVKKLRSVKYNDFVSNYDLQLFCSLILDGKLKGYNSIWQQYASALGTALCGIDAEIATELLKQTDFRSQSPVDGLKLIADQYEYERRGQHDPDHILNLIRSENYEAVQHRIWKAQLQICFPMIELERVSLISKYHDQIAEALHTEYFDFDKNKVYTIKQFGEALN